jgi:DNA polymerase-3 subunit gamma/tau
MKVLLPIDALIDKLDLLRREIHNSPRIIHGQQAAAKPPSLKSERHKEAGHSGSTPQAPAAADDALKNLDATWGRLYEIIAEKNPSLAASLSKCRLTQVSADQVEIEVHDNGFTLNMLQRKKNKAIIEKICRAYFGEQKNVVLVTPFKPEDESPKKKSQNEHFLKQKALSHPLVADAIEVFDGKLIDVKILLD